MNKFQKALAFVKENKVTLIKGTAVGLGATVGLAVGMDLMSKAVASGEEALDNLDNDETPDVPDVVISTETD